MSPSRRGLKPVKAYVPVAASSATEVSPSRRGLKHGPGASVPGPTLSHGGVPLAKGTETTGATVHRSAESSHGGVPLAKGTETGLVIVRVCLYRGHGGVPLAKGTETCGHPAGIGWTIIATEVSPSRRGLKHPIDSCFGRGWHGHGGVPLAKGTETRTIRARRSRRLCRHGGVPLAKGTETVFQPQLGKGFPGHGGVPLAKGTETEPYVDEKTGKQVPRRCPPREGD